MFEGQILDYTHRVAGELAQRCAGDREMELAAWLGMAEQREAMVVQVYDLDAVRRRMPAGADDTGRQVAELAAKALGSIWAQETSHTTLLDSLRRVGGIDGARRDALRGSLEGLVTSLATDSGISGHVARWLVGISRKFDLAPEFTAALAPMSFATFCRFSRELEQTAAEGYERIADLQQRIEDADITAAAARRYGILLHHEVAKTLAEERFHAAVLEAVPDWLTADGGAFASAPIRERVAELRALGDRHLSVSAVARPRSGAGLESREGWRPEAARGDGGPWVSAAGFDHLFRDYGVPVTVAADVASGPAE